jgi:outer membrane protein insertion porin family
LGLEEFGGNTELWRVGTRASYALRLIEIEDQDGLTLTGRGALDWQRPFGITDEIPIIQRLFLGGTGGYTNPSMRGFAYRGVGPREDDEAVGGDVRLGGTLELRYPIKRGTLYFILFYDIGQLQPDITDLRSNHWNQSWGFGLRIRIPISPAPLAFDFGFPIQQYEGDDTQTISFTLGFSF